MSSPEDSFATPRVAAGALFIDARGRVLLVHPTYKDTWDIPGGYVERGESPASACRREVLEELGIDRAPIRLAAVDWAPHEREGDKLLFIFDCGPLGADEARIRLDQRELDSWSWIAVDELDDYLIARLARRVRSVSAGEPKQCLYLEHGILPRAASHLL
ncbi:NUDIX domain-containing protein [Actinomycetospora callitridis]|uniref:NUDIX domain-containing protein n=1 Tax=Actinomycetospora callitridis TaxID=913944 RepID=UPI00236624DE|nr:NUDIX hydrolase [Actinomycetospora callitridis]MDD7917991.1 NUDIX hydrolase [Actinomycetospora callitridis]